ncbi:phage terminase small subunit [Microbulbifer taiwanensis]|nr:phage terminase small subunit [Microbulbifer taiwanensis]
MAKAAPRPVFAGIDMARTPDRAVIETALEADLQLLSERSDVKEKIELKRRLLPKYLPHVKTYREAGEHYPNELLVYCVIWLLDVEDIEPALELADFAIEQQQHLPERFKRDLPTWVAETVHDWAERQYKANQSASPYFEQVLEAVESERWLVTNVIVRTKLYRLAALYAERNSELESAAQWLEKAQAVNPEKAGVKTWLNKLRAKL